MITLLMVLYFYHNGELSTTSQTIQFATMESCEQAKVVMSESVMKFKQLEQFHIGCYKG